MRDDVRFNTLEDVVEAARYYGNYDKEWQPTITESAHRAVIGFVRESHNLASLAAELRDAIEWEQAHPSQISEWRSKRRIQVWRWYLKHLGTEVRS